MLTGNVVLLGDSAIKFGSGTIGTIASGAALTLGASNAYIETGATNSNSALTSLASVAGVLNMGNGAAVSTTKAVVNTGTINFDVGGVGGSSLSTTLGLTNQGTLSIGNAAMTYSDVVAAASLSNTGLLSLAGSTSGVAQALLNINGAAGFGTAGVLTGVVSLTGDSAIKFGSGAISTIASGASLTLQSANSYIETGATNSNSALINLATVSGALTMNNGAAVSSSKAIANYATINIDATGSGGSSLSTTLGLSNTKSGTLSLGNALMTSSDIISAASLFNTGQISLAGSSSAQAMLKIGNAAGFGTAGVLYGNVNLAANSAIQFASGSITTIVAGASLKLGAGNAYLEAGATNSNSALNLLSVISGSLSLDQGAAVASTKAMLIQGSVAIDSLSGEGGSSLATTLLLNNTGVLTLGNSGLSSADSVTAATLANSGRISLTGSGSGQALMKIGSAAGTSGAGKLTGTVYLGYNSAIQFASGSITTIASGASLDLAAGNAYMEVGASNSNSALTGLTSVLGKLLLDQGAAVSLSSLNVSGAMFVDSIGGDGGSIAAISGGLTNSGTLNIGNSNLQGSGASVSAATLTNSGVIDLTGGNGRNASLAVSGTTTNNGAVYLISDSESLAGAVSGTGTFDLFNNSTLGFGSSVSSGQTVTFDGAGALNLGQAGQFAGTIAGGHASDSIDLTNLLWQSGGTLNYTANGGGTGGTLAVTSNGQTVNLLLSGSYTNSSFSIGADSIHTGAGTLITFA